MIDFKLPEFTPHPLLRGGHAQTLAGLYLPGQNVEYRASRHQVNLDDGDQLIVHDDRPNDWRHGDRAVLLIHGLAGCHLSPYMVRTARKLNARGVRTFRMDLRGCGAGVGLARLPYHGGCSHDVRAVLQVMAEVCPESPLGAAGFSLGGNALLKMLGEDPEGVPEQVDRAAAANPPIDLRASVGTLSGWVTGLYDRYFVRRLVSQRQALERARPDVPPLGLAARARRICDFDNLFTAPVSGFGSAQDYYARSSANQFVAKIQVPTWIVTSRDDPLVPACGFESLPSNPAVRVDIMSGGGHLGYVGVRHGDPDGRWLDWRLVDWLVAGRLVS